MGNACFRCPRCGYYDCSYDGEECPVCGLKVKLSEKEVNAVIRGGILSDCVEVIRVEMSRDVLERNG